MKNINIYIDNANVLHTLKGMEGNLSSGGRIIDYTKMVKYISEKLDKDYTINKVFLFDAYVKDDKAKEQSKRRFVDRVKKNIEAEGFKFDSILSKIYYDGNRYVQKGVDMQLGLELFEDVVINDKDIIDSIILISGDGDFIPVIEKVKKYNIEFSLAFFNCSINRDLKKLSDNFIKLEIDEMEYKKKGK